MSSVLTRLRRPSLLLAVMGSILPLESGPTVAANGMVASPEPFATRAGLEVLRGGGNAFDAAVAIGFALAVTYPTAGNLGGGGFLVGVTGDGKPVTIDFREKAPAAARRDMYLDQSGAVRKGASTSSYEGTSRRISGHSSIICTD